MPSIKDSLSTGGGSRDDATPSRGGPRE
jgi:hypothetical protein